MKIASWNVNSINARLPRILEWLGTAAPDIAVLQEIKCISEKFPIEAIENKGYNVAVHGQKTYNGVALLSRFPFEDLKYGLPGRDNDPQSRYIEALILPSNTFPVRVGGLYLPNGNPAPGPKYDYKLDWMKDLYSHTLKLLTDEEPFLLAGDFNVIPQDEDTWDPEKWMGDALFRPETHAAYRKLLHTGLCDALRHLMPEEIFYTFWDYQRGAWQKDHGIRIDHFLLSPQITDRLLSGGVDKYTRDPMVGDNSVKPSDHVPVWVEIS